MKKITQINFFLVCFLVIFLSKSVAQFDVSKSIITDSLLKNYVYELADDSMEGRKHGSRGWLMAANKIADYFKENGLRKVSGLNGYFQKIIVKAKKDSFIINNIVGVIPGTSKKNEVVLFSAHYDHIGMGINGFVKGGTLNILDILNNKPNTTEIYNGANDDASGVASMLALAKYFSSMPPPERTIMFVAFDMEEEGMIGSQIFSNFIADSLIIAQINLEMLGRKMDNKGFPFITGDLFSDFRKILNATIEKETGEKKYFNTDPVPKHYLFSRSDNYSFARMGVPAHTIMLTTDEDEYYHNTRDKPMTLDYETMANIVQHIAIAVQPLVDGISTPTRINPKNF